MFNSVSYNYSMKKRTMILGGIGLVLLVWIGVSATRTKIPQYETMAVAKGNVEQKVSVTGKVKPAEALDLAFEQSGKIASVSVKVGDQVEAGKLLATLNSADVSASLRRASAAIGSARADVLQYQAALQNEQVQLEELKNGTRSEELLLAELNVQKAETTLLDEQNNLVLTQEKTVLDLQNIYDDVPETLQSAFTLGNTAFLEDIAALFIRGTNLEYLSFITKDSENKNTLERERISLKNTMSDFQSDIFSVPTDSLGRDAAITSAQQKLLSLRTFLNALSVAIDDNADLSVADENLYRSYVNTARTSVNTALESLVAQTQAIATQKATNKNTIQAAQASVNTAQKVLDLTHRELDLKKAGARPEQIAAQEARIKQAQASLSSAQSRLSQVSADYQGVQANFQKTQLRAPIRGIVTKVEAENGEFIASSVTAVALISEGDYEVEANIPEVDIAKIELGKTAQVTLDAYGESVVFQSQITKIDPAETIVEGIATYKVTLQFVEKDERIKSGMTANTEILVESRENVVSIPIRALQSRDGKKFVKIVRSINTLAEEVEVETGLSGSTGDIEITRGLSGGETLVLSEGKAL